MAWEDDMSLKFTARAPTALACPNLACQKIGSREGVEFSGVIYDCFKFLRAMLKLGY